MTDTQQLVGRAFAGRFEQVERDYDEALREHEERRQRIVMNYYHHLGDLERAYYLDLRSEYPLCLNPTLNLVPKLIETRWGVLFG